MRSMWKPERAKQLIKREGRTRDWLANECGVTVESLSHHLSGRRKPSLPVLLHMARALHCDASELDDEVGNQAVG